MKAISDKTPNIDLEVDLSHDNYLVNESQILYLAKTLLTLMGQSHSELSLLIVNDQKIRSLNKKFRNKDKATDVLSFPQSNWERPLLIEEKSEPTEEQEIMPTLLGDIVISLDHVALNAKKLNHSISREFCFLLIHGLLHLCGHDHMEEEEEELMTLQQRKLLKLLEEFSERKTGPLWFNCLLEKDI